MSFNVRTSTERKAFVLSGLLLFRAWNQKGVLFGPLVRIGLNDVDKYLTHGTNKKVFYKIFQTVEDIDERAIVKLLKEAVRLDKQWSDNQPTPKVVGFPRKVNQAFCLKNLILTISLCKILTI